MHFTILQQKHNWANNIKQTKLTSSSFSSRLHTELRYLPEIRLESHHFRSQVAAPVENLTCHVMELDTCPRLWSALVIWLSNLDNSQSMAIILTPSMTTEATSQHQHTGPQLHMTGNVFSPNLSFSYYFGWVNQFATIFVPQIVLERENQRYKWRSDTFFISFITEKWNQKEKVHYVHESPSLQLLDLKNTPIHSLE